MRGSVAWTVEDVNASIMARPPWKIQAMQSSSFGAGCGCEVSSLFSQAMPEAWVTDKQASD
jgi:hypothetical protein